MNVGIAMLTLVPGLSGGSETYARALTAMLAREGRNSYSVLAPTIAPDAGGGLPTVVAASYRASSGTPGRIAAMAATTLRPGELRRELDQADVVHYPLTIPLPQSRRPTVVTLLDVQHLDLPGLFTRSERAFRRLAYDRAARRADHVIVISEWVRERAVERLGLDPRRVHAIHLGVDRGVFTPDDTVAREPFLLYPARPWAHKNHGRLLEAFSLVRQKRPELRLVLTGVGHEPTTQVGVEIRGSVSRDELVDLYRRAAALVFPSLYEGFGLPPVEAMACGCPVAASSSGSLPEICGDAAVLFDPTAPEAIASGIETALSRAPELAGLGLARAANFTWEATARRHDDVYDAMR